MANQRKPAIVKKGIPEWLTFTVILLMVIPSMGLFGLSLANSAAATGFYGIEPADAQYSMILFYAGVVSFYSFEIRLFSFVKIRDYLLISTVVEIITSYVCYQTKSLGVLFIFRFIQGMGNCAGTSICITLLFNRLQSERAREIGYSLFYGLLLIVSQLTTLLSAPVIDAFDYNVLYKAIVFMYLPGAVFLYIILNNIRMSRRLPLVRLDWVSFVLYAAATASLGYVLVYGETEDWFTSKNIVTATLGGILLFCIFFLRQTTLKRPYMNISVFKYRNFLVGAALLFALYLARGGLNLSSAYFASILKLDPRHQGIILLANVGGALVGVFIASRLVLQKIPFKLIYTGGFSMLLLFYCRMIFLFSIQGNLDVYVIPLFVHGLGAGLLMVPIIMYMISSVPSSCLRSASGYGILIRYTAFCTSMAFINIFSRHSASQHYTRFLYGLSSDNPLFAQGLSRSVIALQARGLSADRAAAASNQLLYRSIDAQLQIRLCMEYYQTIAYGLAAVLLILLSYPYFQKTIINLKRAEPAAVGF